MAEGTMGICMGTTKGREVYGDGRSNAATVLVTVDGARGNVGTVLVAVLVSDMRGRGCSSRTVLAAVLVTVTMVVTAMAVMAVMAATVAEVATGVAFAAAQ